MPPSDQPPLTSDTPSVSAVTTVELADVWDRLLQIRSLRFEARSHAPARQGWNGDGRGEVRVESPDAATLLFHESGRWTSEHGRELAFTNTYRWSLDASSLRLRLEHLRFGPLHPVYLFDLSPVSSNLLESVEPHVCQQDLYTARMELDATELRLDWRIVGPEKDERIRYWYR